MNPLKTWIDILFLISTLIFSVGLILAFARQRCWADRLFGAGLACQALSLTLRYAASFPLMPVYQGPFFLPFAAGLGAWAFTPGETSVPENGSAGSCAKFPHCFPVTLVRLFPVVTLSWLALLFPNDFYLPHIQFKTVFAHLFFILGVAGRALFLVSGALAAGGLWHRAQRPGRPNPWIKPMGKTVLWGFTAWTLSVFSGAAWSWLGWGSPVVWDDPLMATAMATWLLYGLVLHLHLTWFSSARSRAVCILGAAAFVFVFTCAPELGPFRPLGWHI